MTQLTCFIVFIWNKTSDIVKSKESHLFSIKVKFYIVLLQNIYNMYTFSEQVFTIKHIQTNEVNI